MLTYGDGVRHREAAHILGMSERNVYYLLPAARRRLTDVLDRLDLLQAVGFAALRCDIV